MGDVGTVVFPCGWIADEKGNVRIYYGAADTSICLATVRVDDLLNFMKDGLASGLGELPKLLGKGPG